MLKEVEAGVAAVDRDAAVEDEDEAVPNLGEEREEEVVVGEGVRLCLQVTTSKAMAAAIPK